jgi:hypothetical protein
MGYINIFLPLVLGLLFIFAGSRFVNPDDVVALKRRATMKILGYFLVLVAVAFAVVKFVN